MQCLTFYTIFHFMPSTLTKQILFVGIWYSEEKNNSHSIWCLSKAMWTIIIGVLRVRQYETFNVIWLTKLYILIKLWKKMIQLDFSKMYCSCWHSFKGNQNSVKQYPPTLELLNFKWLQSVLICSDMNLVKLTLTQFDISGKKVVLNISWSFERFERLWTANEFT